MGEVGCSLCLEIAGHETGVCPEYDSIINTGCHILADYGSNVLIPSIGSLCPGHVLLCPKQHIASYRSSIRPNVTTDLPTAIDAVKDKFKCQAVAFEHGTAADGKCRSACIDHAHIHIIPTSKALRPLIAIPRVLASQHYYLPPSNLDYTYLRDIDGHEFLLAVNESQYLRKIWSLANGGIQWNWRMNHGIDNIRQTIHAWHAEGGGQPDAFGAV
ncbi:MAG: HIT domain-containing protein [Pseudomonadales bacterium]